MNASQKKKETERIEVRLKNEMPRILREIEVYEKALNKGALNPKPKSAPQYNLG